MAGDTEAATTKGHGGLSRTRNASAGPHMAPPPSASTLRPQSEALPKISRPGRLDLFVVQRRLAEVPPRGEVMHEVIFNLLVSFLFNHSRIYE